jgi:CubicO group peptidase (beta-lactamase class C family)
MRASAFFGVAVSILISLAAGTSAHADAVDDYVRAAMEEQRIPGVSIAIVKDGEPVKLQGYGLANVELGAPATADTIYQSGSVGKQFTAAGILLLAEDGKLGLEDRLSRHFPSGPAGWHRVRVRHLLTHTSGLKDYGEDEIDFRRDYTEAELLQVAMKVPLEFEPGTQWSYSNTGYTVLGLLTSKLAGKHWSEFLEERLFGPLGMTTARVISESEIVTGRADGYELGEDKALRNQEWVAPTLNSLADGALYFTVRDLVAWDTALRERQFLKPASFEAWWTPVALTGESSYPYGFGWDISEQRGRRLIEHGGSWQGFRAAIARYVEDGLTVAVLANLADARPEAIAHEVAGIVVEALRLPDPGEGRTDPVPGRTDRLRAVLTAWAESGTLPQMGRGLAATASGSAREAFGRKRTSDRLAALKSFSWLAADDLESRPLDWRGETVTAIAHYLLETADARYAYRFYLTGDGRVADFSSERR